MVFEQKKKKKNKEEKNKENQWHSNDNVKGTIHKKRKKSAVYLLEFWLKFLYFGLLCQSMALKQGHFYIFNGTILLLFFSKIAIILSTM